MTGTGSEQQQLDRELWERLVDVRRSRRRKVLCLPDLVLDFIKSWLGTWADDDPDDRSTVQVKVPPLQIIIVLSGFIFFVNYSSVILLLPDPISEGKCESSYVRCWRSLRDAELPCSGAHAWPSCWNSEAKRPWRSRLPRAWTKGEDVNVLWLTEGLGGLKLTSRCLKTLTGMDSEQQQLDRELWERFLNVRRFWNRKMGYYLTRQHFLISSSYLQGLMHRHLHCWMLVMMRFNVTHLQFNKKWLLGR
jgi:hypothetical protein